MEKIDKQLNNISLIEVPIGLHQSVMRKINYKKLQPMLLVVFSLLAFNFIVIVWHINAKLIDAEFIDMVRDFLDALSFNFSFISTIFTSFFEIVSPILVLSAIASLIGAIYTGKKITFYHYAKS